VNTAGTNVYVVDQANSRVQSFSPTGTYLGQRGGSGGGSGSFTTPSGVLVDPTGNIYVTDQNNLIQKFTP